MQFLLIISVLLASYFLGSIPFGLIIVRLTARKDIRQVASGRTGGTNAFRAAGIWAGLATALFDLLKSAFSVWMARAVLPGYSWIEILAPVMAILGHNHSIFLAERDPSGRIRLRGGAGGASCVGGAFGLWPPIVLIILPISALLWYFVGYASITTLSVGLMAVAIFAYRAWIGASPWQYIFYGVFAEILLILALRPNISRIISGNERVVGFRARKKKKSSAEED
jgi:acyl phosphate:glycerol-3-phosphate acyltransferase